MSSAYGQCQFPDGVVMHFRYDGTYDHCVPKLFSSARHLTDAWRKEPEVQCNCSEPHSTVALAVDYGDGCEWQATACRACHCITSDFNPWLVGRSVGLPLWWRD